MRTTIITDAAELAALEPAWWDLFARVPDATPFAAPAWLLPWWRTFAPGSLWVVALSEGERLTGLAPLYLEDGPHGRRLLPMGIGLTDALDILVDPTRADAVGAALGRALAEVPPGLACWSAEDALPGAAVLALATPPGWSSTCAPQSACPVLALSGPAREAIPPRQRRKWQMARNRAARRACLVVATTPDTVLDDLGHLQRLHSARWRERGEPGVLADPAVGRFHALALPALLAAGLLRMTTLQLDGEVAGVYFGLQRGSGAFAYLGGFDPGFAFESPGTLLIGAAIEAAAAEGVRAFSFLRGQEAYKYAWGATDIWTHRRLLEPPR